MLKGLDLFLSPGETIGVAGPNGSGKTTLLRLLATLIAPDRGEGQVLGAALGTSAVYPVRPLIGVIGHQPSLISELTIEENLNHAATLGGIELARVTRALSAVGLAGASGRRVNASSFGMSRRTELALILLRRPRLLLLDEPLSGLDGQAAGLVAAIVDTITTTGGGVMVVSHDPSHLSGCDRVMRLPDGSIEETR